ncbi:MAG: hypothetical protein LBS25_04530 [Candidatus Symbiothrix sp.]|jgi:hypothetical protein|nr:hypothetical protein [Candidatus Symbiothrix sp.]
MAVVEIVLFAFIGILLLLVTYLLWQQIVFRDEVIKAILSSDRLNTYFYSLFTDAKKIVEDAKSELKAEIIAELSAQNRHS